MPDATGWVPPQVLMALRNNQMYGSLSEADIMALMNEQVNFGPRQTADYAAAIERQHAYEEERRRQFAHPGALSLEPGEPGWAALVAMGGAAAGGAFRGAGSGSATVAGSNTAAGVAPGAVAGTTGGIVPGAGGAAGGGFSGGAVAPAVGGAAAAGGVAAGLNWATLVPSIVSGVTGILGAREQAGAAGDALALSERMFDTAREDALPRIRAGNAAVDVLADLQGLYTGTPNMARFTQSPDYQFNLEQGTQAGERALGAMGLRQSGPMVKEAGRFASGLASREYGSFVDRLLATAGLGTTGAAQSAAAGANNASIGGNALLNQGAARSSGYGAVNDSLQGYFGNRLLEQYLRRAPG